MSGNDCERVRDLLPIWVREELDSDDGHFVEEHISVCGECRADAGLLRALRASTPTPPEDLEARVRSSVAATPVRRHAWMSRQFAAAAVVVLALGTALIWNQRPGDGDGVLTEEPLALTWPSDDGFIAGVALLDDLTDEALEELLEELEG